MQAENCTICASVEATAPDTTTTFCGLIHPGVVVAFETTTVEMPGINVEFQAYLYSPHSTISQLPNDVLPISEMRFTCISFIKSEYAGSTFFSLFQVDKGVQALSPPPAPSNTPEPIFPGAEDDEETVVSTTEFESSDSATLNSVEPTDGDLDVFEVNARYPLIVRSSFWRPDVQSIIVRREGSSYATCMIINPIPRCWIPRLPVFSLPNIIKLGSLCFRRRAIEASPSESDEQQQPDEDLFTLEKESEQDAREITQVKRGGPLASLGWTGVFPSTNSKKQSAAKAPEFEVDEAGRLIVPSVDVNVTYLVTKEVEVFTDDDLALLRVMTNCVI